MHMEFTLNSLVRKLQRVCSPIDLFKVFDVILVGGKHDSNYGKYDFELIQLRHGGWILTAKMSFLE